MPHPIPPDAGSPAAFFERAATDPEQVILEGFHALKHAWRFGADILAVMTTSLEHFQQLAEELAPDLLGPVAPLLSVGRPPHGESHWTGVWAVARRRGGDPATILGELGKPTGPVVLLEDPRNLGNLGACIRVAAAAGAAGLLVLGTTDPWSPVAVRGAAGLQFALPVANTPTLGATSRPIVALDPEGERLRPGLIPPNALLAFGTEREGLSETLLSRAAVRLRIPMMPGVSSLNLAVSVGITLYAGRALDELPS